MFVLLLERFVFNFELLLQRLDLAREELLAERDVLGEETLERLRSMGGMVGWWYGPDPRRFLEDEVGLQRLRW